MMKTHRMRPRARAAGFTLVEFLVALVIGLLIVLAAVASLFGTRATSLSSDNVASLEQAAAAAFQQMRSQIAQAGYAPIDLVHGNRGYFDTTGLRDTLLATAPAFFAVDGTEGGTGANDTVTVGFAPTVDGFADCLGQTARSSSGTAYNKTAPFSDNNVRLVTSRFEVADGNLHCLGSGKAQSQPLIAGVERFNVRYGVETPASGSYGISYRDANAVTDFSLVRNVILCLQLVAPNGGAPTQTYRDCDGVEQTAGDGRQRGVYRTTIALRNTKGLL